MTGALSFGLLAAGLGSYAVGRTRARDFGHRAAGLALIGAGMMLGASPARADQFRQAADNAEVSCVVSARELTRISLVGDAFANVSKITSGVPGLDFTVTSEPVRGDVYLSVPDGWSAPALSFFATSRKGYVYKFACTVDDVPAEQVFVANPALAISEEGAPAATSPSQHAIELIRTMAAGGVPKGYTVRQPAAAPTRVGDLELRLVAEYRGAGLTGRHFRVDNRGDATVTLDPGTAVPGPALAVSVGVPTLAPKTGTNLFVVQLLGEGR